MAQEKVPTYFVVQVTFATRNAKLGGNIWCHNSQHTIIPLSLQLPLPIWGVKPEGSEEGDQANSTPLFLALSRPTLAGFKCGHSPPSPNLAPWHLINI